MYRELLLPRGSVLCSCLEFSLHFQLYQRTAQDEILPQHLCEDRGVSK